MTRRVDRVHDLQREVAVRPRLGWARSGPELVLDAAGRIDGTTEPATAEQAVRLLLEAIERTRGSTSGGEAVADLIIGLWRLGFEIVAVSVAVNDVTDVTSDEHDPSVDRAE